MIWATPDEVRTYLDVDQLPDGYPDDQLQRDIDRVTRLLAAKVVRFPALNEQDRPEDPEVRAHVIAAVAEQIKHARKLAADRAALDGALGGMADVLRAGGSISTKTLSASGASRSGSSGASQRAMDVENRLSLDTIDALVAAGMLGGSVAAW
ncbi:hypothetical protein [Amycolatopsis thermophila]|uniref:Uncharacterized protein n=1 Tax=Amycolatopsis thermophila TaxID=206084 RepID=A0ABU0ERN1_9PSEU|nr:hypothetical protein [Amycolatopsis thermophila]MDQ0377959.1 hypothetical protein [Amycolatopsis thermophila]